MYYNIRATVSGVSLLSQLRDGIKIIKYIIPLTVLTNHINTHRRPMAHDLQQVYYRDHLSKKNGRCNTAVFFCFIFQCAIFFNTPL